MTDTSQTIVTADLYDAHHDIVQVCTLQFRSFGRRTSFCGPCETLRVFQDHTPVLAAVVEPGRGRVLVVDAGGELKIGVMGDRIAGKAQENGWSGVVINGAVRDTMGLNAIDIGVKALGATARRSWVPASSSRGQELNFGGTRFRAGDWIYADLDAVIVSNEPLTIGR
ncbi:ribonuclease E activity regulator RraA [Solirhodobacter olei]|uniref:ribonuclease E activity regulator RraA n=1 Tax=Solirhodobacter olei TaxID=2493082 RepID=UPI000FDBB93A|nr:ribonuclease E activity regulator RraA [Solirhodobacter olei]